MSDHVLVIDDDAAIRRLLEVSLETEGIRVETARDGVVGIRCAVDDPPSLVILDVMMPELDGWAVAERLAANPSTATVPVVFLSARTRDEDLEKGMALGAAAYVTKPFDVSDLLDLVHEVLGPA